MTPPPITETDLACARAGDRVGPEDAAWFLGVTPENLAYWRKARRGPPYYRAGYRLFRYAMADLCAWRGSPVQ